ncbi:hypothetical protein B8W55_21920 [Cronobacter sakazakii]|nr:hypothetical protein C5945_21905 [Cronobacter sakazakii]PUY90568.1 hypothetical protein B8W55_21920 [Cronobacter sakazakii]
MAGAHSLTRPTVNGLFFVGGVRRSRTHLFSGSVNRYAMAGALTLTRPTVNGLVFCRVGKA